MTSVAAKHHPGHPRSLGMSRIRQGDTNVPESNANCAAVSVNVQSKNECGMKYSTNMLHSCTVLTLLACTPCCQTCISRCQVDGNQKHKHTTKQLTDQHSLLRIVAYLNHAKNETKAKPAATWAPDTKYRELHQIITTLLIRLTECGFGHCTSDPCLLLVQFFLPNIVCHLA
jgi:hypothetical protein